MILKFLSGLAAAGFCFILTACGQAQFAKSATILEQGKVAQAWNTIVMKEGSSFLHFGVDIETTPSAAVKAPKQLTVTFAGQRAGYGKAVFLADEGGNEIRISNLESISVTDGERCDPGEIVGYAEPRSAEPSKPVFVHVEYRPRGEGPVDPEAAIPDLLF